MVTGATMGKFAIVDGGVVTNLARSDVALAPNWVACGGAAVCIGDTWDGETFSSPPLVVDLEKLRAAKNDEINAERERRVFDSFQYAGKTISCDTLSRSDIDGINGYVALNNAFPDGWPGAWKCADNTYLTIATVAEWKSFYGSMVTAGSALYARAQELKAALARAQTAEEIAAITW